MSNSRPSNAKFWIWTGLTITLSAGLVASAWPATRAYLASQSVQLERAGESSGGAAATLDFHLAHLLDPASPVAAWHYAGIQLANGDAKGALATLNQAIFTAEPVQGRVIRTQAQLEVGDVTQAATVAAILTGTNSTEEQLTVAALAFGAAGEGSRAAALQGRVSSPQAARAVAQAASGKLALAQALSTHGLVRSASRILQGLPSTPPRDLLLARLNAASGKTADLRTAADLYRNYLVAMPADAITRLEYATALDRLDRTAEAKTERVLAANLQAGRP